MNVISLTLRENRMCKSKLKQYILIFHWKVKFWIEFYVALLCTQYSTLKFKYIKVSAGFCQRYNGAVTERNTVSRHQTNNGWYFLQLQPAAPSAKLPAGFEVLPFNGASKSCRRRRSGRASTGSSPPCPSPSSRSRSEHSWWSSAANLSVQETNY